MGKDVSRRALAMKRFNLLYVIEGGPYWGGAEEMLLNVLKSIDRDVYSVEVCCLVGGHIADTLRTADVPVTVLNMRNKWDFHAVWKLVSMLKRNNIHIIHTSLYASNAFGRMASIMARTPVTIAWEHDTAHVKPARHVLVDRFLGKFTDFITVPSEAIRQSIIERENISGEKIGVIHNFVDMARFSISVDSNSKRTELGLEQEDIVIGCVGSLSEHKGQRHLVDAAPRVIDSFPKAKFLLVGEGPLRSELEEKIKSMDLNGKVVLSGFRRGIPEIMGIMDLYVQPSLREAFGISIIEAMAMGKPVVASRVGGIPEVVKDGETGVLVPPGDSKAISETIVKLLGDKGRALKMGRAGSERVRTHFTSEAAVGGLERLYEKFIVTKILPGKESLSEEEVRLQRSWIKQYFSCHDGKSVRNPALDYEHEVRQKGLLKLLKLTPGERVLDVGCGRCGDILFLSSSGARFTGMDLSETAVAEGKRNLRNDTKMASLIVADGACLPFKNNVFDKVYCKESLEHIPHYEAAIEEIARVLKPGGIVAVTCPNWFSMKGLGRLWGWLKIWIANRGESHPYDVWKTQGTMERCLLKCGLEVKEKLGMDFLPGIMCYKLSNKSQVYLVRAVRFMESKFLWRLTAFGNAIGLSAVKKSDSLKEVKGCASTG